MVLPNNKHTVLIVEDQLQVRSYLEMALRHIGYGVESAQDGEAGLSLLRAAKTEISAILLDLMLPDSEGMETLEAIRATVPNVPIIIVSGASSTMNVVAAMKCGATDFLSKPVSRDDLRLSLTKALESQVLGAHAALSARPESLAADSPLVISPHHDVHTFVGENPRMKEIESLIPQVGWSEVPVLIQGETGTGKEVLARQLHAHSPRASQPFLKLNCAALPSELVESELFGYERGAFTGAFQKKAGMFEMADGGTILLDEIGDMDVRLQAKLLQVLQDREFHRIGGKVLVKVNVRLLAATHRDLERAIANGQFREDLYYRLNVMNFHLPPLRERKEDVPALAEHLLRKHTPAGSAPPFPPGTPLPLDLQHALMAYQWPGNVRELENVMRRYVVLRDPDLIARELHRKTSRGALRTPLAGAPGRPALLAPDDAAPDDPIVCEATAPILEQVTKAKQQAETEAILAALRSTRWNRKQAAGLLKIDYKALLYKMKKLNVDEQPPRTDERRETTHIGTIRFSSKIA
jgi:two-component system, NtrC family, response regulator AtoC